MRFVIIRHTERDTTDPHHTKNTNMDISENGVKIAENNASELNKLFNLRNFTIISSPLKRAVKTGIIFSKILNVDTEISIDYRLIEGQTKPPYMLDEFDEGMRNVGIEYPESFDNIRKRIELLFSDIIKKENDGVILITHGIIFNFILQNFFNNYEFDLDWDKRGNHPSQYFPPYCACAVVDIDNDNKSHAKLVWSNCLLMV